MKIKQFDFIVATLPFQGQYAIAEIFNKLGIECHKHKSIDDWSFSCSHSCDEKTISGDVSWFAAPYLDQIHKSTIILHQTVSPLTALDYLENSQIFDNWETDYLHSYKNNYFTNKFVKYQGRKWKWPITKQEKSEYFYLKWNELIEEKSKNLKYMRFKAESINEETLEHICWFIGANIASERISDVFAKYSVPAFNAPDRELSKEIKQMAIKYDYDLKS